MKINFSTFLFKILFFFSAYLVILTQEYISFLGDEWENDRIMFSKTKYKKEHGYLKIGETIFLPWKSFKK